MKKIKKQYLFLLQLLHLIIVHATLLILLCDLICIYSRGMELTLHIFDAFDAWIIRW